MAILSWRARKKLTYFLAPLFFIAGVILLVLYLGSAEATCYDGKQNQGEEGIDCGGPCQPCVVNPKELVALWTRVLSTDKEGVYEAASLIKNPNLFYGLSLFKYTFKLYDSNNILVAVKEGQTYLNPNEKFVVFATDIDTGQRKPVRAFVEIEPVSEWEYVEVGKKPLLVSSKNFINIPFPRLEAKLFNESLFFLKDISAVGVLYDDRGNAIGVSSTKVDSVAPESTANFAFTWPSPFSQSPVSTEIFVRVNLLGD
jgi:hypothetical protein